MPAYRILIDGTIITNSIAGGTPTRVPTSKDINVTYTPFPGETLYPPTATKTMDGWEIKWMGMKIAHIRNKSFEPTNLNFRESDESTGI